MPHKRLPLLLTVLFLTAGCHQTAPPPTTDYQGDWAKMRTLTPRGYACGRAHTPIKIDGRGDDPAWAAAPWTEDFVDIEGNSRPAPRFRTRAKMLWDDENLYIHAELQEPHVWGTLTQKNSIMFNDNDFELFINPSGDNHNYYEFEMNALNSIWELTLEKPYRDGGPAHLGDNIEGLRSAVFIDGTLNNPADTDHGWSVDIAIPWKGLHRYATPRICPPVVGEQWRMNFSRVEWIVDIIDGKYRKIPREMRPEDNWVWSPPGVIDMHRPERYGFVQFCESAAGIMVKPDPSLPTRDALMEVYHRQRHYHEQMNRYAATLAELGMMPAQSGEAKSAITLELTADGYMATSKFRATDGTEHVLHVRQDSLLSEE